MKGKSKVVVGDIQRGVELDKNIPLYMDMFNNSYNKYSLVKMCMNFYTMSEGIQELEDKKTDVCVYFNNISNVIKQNILSNEKVDIDRAIEAVTAIREAIEYKMHILTSYSDAIEIYEYILNRVEAGLKDTIEDVNVEQLCNGLISYVFSENDPVVVNSKLQLIIAQLPVRMTKQKFYDIICNTISIYKGGEKRSVNEFADTLRRTVLINKPKGFENEYPFLYTLYSNLKDTDYKMLTVERYDELEESISQAAAIIERESSDYVLLQEIVNDVFAVLLTISNNSDVNIDDEKCVSAKRILTGCVTASDIDTVLVQMMEDFGRLEGVQEDTYSELMIFEGGIAPCETEYNEIIDNLKLRAYFDNLVLMGKLTSTSLFIELSEKKTEDETEADAEYIDSIKEQVAKDFAKLFSGMKKPVVRSVMGKILGSMPVFFNSKQEISEYFTYTLGGCDDTSELTACNKLFKIMMED